MGYRPRPTGQPKPLHPPGWVQPDPDDGRCFGCRMDDLPLALVLRRWRCPYCAELAQLHHARPMPNPGVREDGKRCRQPGCTLARGHTGYCWGRGGWVPLADLVAR